MKYIQVTKDNIDQEHICCAISKETDIQVSSKKDWLRSTLKDGLVFFKSQERGKCFIEYLPAENAWIPLDAPNYMYIDCFWVSGSFKGHGYANDLLEACIQDSKKKKKAGLCVLSSEKKRPFLSDPDYLKYKGFQLADTSSVGIELLYLPFQKNAKAPKLKSIAKNPKTSQKGFVWYYTNQCPFLGKYVPLVEKAAKDHKIPLKVIHITTKQQAQNVPSPCTTSTLFYNGKWITNEVLNDKKLFQLADKLMK